MIRTLTRLIGNDQVAAVLIILFILSASLVVLAALAGLLLTKYYFNS